MISVLNLFDIVPGRQKQYAEYLRRVRPLLEKYGAKLLVYGQTRMVYMGNCTQEYCGIVSYPNVESLKGLSHDEQFKAIRLLRDDSTTNFVMTTIEEFKNIDAAIEHLDDSL
ncbi:MAG: DUF1330 domain-containing protein [Planctomycetes bacterium]|nr:DUF1330 domain-containing protein [Planctomycetota bacterium]